MQSSPPKIALVYQAGLANVFRVDNFSTAPESRGTVKRLLQHAFSPCVWYARGLRAAGATVEVFAANYAGDIAAHDWDTRIDEAPFCDSPDFMTEIS